MISPGGALPIRPGLQPGQTGETETKLRGEWKVKLQGEPAFFLQSRKELEGWNLPQALL